MDIFGLFDHQIEMGSEFWVLNGGFLLIVGLFIDEARKNGGNFDRSEVSEEP